MIRLDQEGQSDGNLVAEKRVDFGYNTAGLVSSIAQFIDLDGTSGAEVATSTYSYDTLGRLTDLAHKNGGVDLFTPYDWSYDNLHRITQFVSADGTSDYEYDKTSQLTVADHDYQTNEAYSYDANGNRTMTGYVTGDNNQLLDDGTYTYTYDDEGNRLTRTNDTTDEVTEYAWDYRNRLTRVTEKDELGAITQVVAYADDQLLAQENVEETISDPERVRWPLVDNLGTVRDLIDNEGCCLRSLPSSFRPASGRIRCGASR